MKLVENDGTVIEINSQGSHGTSAEMSPDKLKDEAALQSNTAVAFANEDDKNFGFLDFDANLLANSIGSIGKDN